MFLVAIASLFISLLSPFLGYIFLVSVGGKHLLFEHKKRAIFAGIILSGLLILYFLGAISILEISDIGFSVLFVSWIFILVFLKTRDYTQAIYAGSLCQAGYAIIRGFLLSDIYQQRIEALFQGYENLFGNGVVALENGNGQLEGILTEVQRILIEYQTAIWGITMILAVYIGALFLSRRTPIKWQHHLMKLPHSITYILIITLFIAIFPDTRMFGLNFLFVILAILLLQGLAIVDYWCKKHLKKSRFVMLAIVFLMFINIFFALMVSLLGLIDNWLDIRKINHL